MSNEKIDALGVEGAESAKAVQEASKTASNAIDAYRDFSSFWGRVLGPSIENLGAIAQYKTEYWKIKNGIKHKEKVEEILRERGDTETKYIPPRLGIPILEGATSEDNENLQDLWAGLLANGMTGKEDGFIKKSYIEALRQLDPLEAMLLRSIFSMQVQKNNKQQSAWMSFGDQTTQIKAWIALRNLERLSMIKIYKEANENAFAFTLVMGRQEDAQGEIDTIQTHIEMTGFGWNFYVSCASKTKEMVIILDYDEYIKKTTFTKRKEDPSNPENASRP